MEVIVMFLGGDTDRPLITGCVQNALNVPPFALPGNRTKSGIKTRSTPGSRGYNELSFEDGAGKEQVRLHAARDLVESVSRDREATVGRSRITRIARDDVEHIGGGKTVHVTGAWKEHARGHRSSSCDGDVAQTVGGQLVHKVGGTSSTTVDKSYVLHVAGNGDVVFGSEDKECHHSLFVHGDHLIGARDAIRFRADKAIVFQCGDSVLELSPDGLRIHAKRVDVVAAESTSIAGKGSALRLADEAQAVAKTLRLFSEEASLVLDKDAKLKGHLVKLNCDDEKPTSTTADDKPIETKPFKMKLSDAEYGTYADKKFHLLVDGATYEGTTDADGMVVKAIPKEAKSVSIVLWISDYPTGAQKTWTISVEEMPDASTVRGAQQRLSNLGYYHGEPGDKMDERTRDAIRDFQAHVGLPSTGELDAATVGKLNTLHGK
jgi:type VI secretion system secreted protein VgrG